MTDLEALAKLASEATREAEHEAEYRRTHPAIDWELFTARHEFRDAASPDVVLALVRVALVAKSHHPGGIVGGTCEICAALADLR
jgi:hypothetical protein